MRPTLTLLALAALALAASAQMEKREADLYDAETFAAFPPAVGTPAPAFALARLDGTPWSLEACRGRVVVLIKGSFT